MRFLIAILKKSKNRDIEESYLLIASQEREIIPRLIRNLTDFEDYALVRLSQEVVASLSQAEFSDNETPLIS